MLRSSKSTASAALMRSSLSVELAPRRVQTWRRFTMDAWCRAGIVPLGDPCDIRAHGEGGSGSGSGSGGLEDISRRNASRSSFVGSGTLFLNARPRRCRATGGVVDGRSAHTPPASRHSTRRTSARPAHPGARAAISAPPRRTAPPRRSLLLLDCRPCLVRPVQSRTNSE